MPVFLILVVVLTIPVVQGDSGQRLCGSELGGMLELVCGGQFFGSGFKKRSSDFVNYDELESSETDLKTLLKPSFHIKRGGVADECCIRSCTIDQLLSYCLNDPSNSLQSQINALLTSDNEAAPLNEDLKTQDGTTQITTANDIPETTTQPIRSGVRTRQRNRWFFLQFGGQNPTRRPF